MVTVAMATCVANGYRKRQEQIYLLPVVMTTERRHSGQLRKGCKHVSMVTVARVTDEQNPTGIIQQGVVVVVVVVVTTAFAVFVLGRKSTLLSL